ncbi:phytanoyl-CoA dioxygenase family protein [Mucilaginibacter sp.]|jgi:ectoine hydroxylase-related dioxygenase (phytanoyl-CoA dioxygenase family)|uniref:phytanoyl-CoA dioxygenase family protein n=1 Tax=Mucilaginibacter sp. TaxID=1882438 RepID=UPI003563AA82
MITKNNSLLTPDQVTLYHENGYLLPNIPLFDEAKFERLFEIFEEHLANRGNLRPDELNAPHLTDDRLFDFLLADEVIDVVSAVIGPNVGLWSSGFICKEPKTGQKTPWHEDSAYWEGRFNNFDGIVTIWLAIDEATTENGCMGVLPGTHHNGFSEYENMGTDHKIFNFQIKNSLINENDVVWFELKKNRFSLHDSRIIHGANANTSQTRRTGYTMRYFNTDMVFNREHPNNLNKKIYHCRGDNQGNNPLIYLK